MESVVISEDFEEIRYILKSSSSRLSLTKELSRFSVKNNFNELTGYKESN